MLDLKDFYFVRHGETDWNKERRGMGQMDIPLNATGVRQAKEAARALTGAPIELICHSPLQRAKVTAEIIAQALDRPRREIPDLIECGWGEFEGKIKGPWLEQWIAGATIPGAESYRDFVKRALSGVRQALSTDATVLIVSHGGVYWAIQEAAKLGPPADLRNGAPVLFRAPEKLGEPWTFDSIL